MRALSARAGALLIALLLAAPTPAMADGSPVSPPVSGPAGARALRALQHAIAHEFRVAGGTGSALVVDETTGQTLFSQAPTAPLLPASLEKLYTTSAALVKFGAQATLQTSVLGQGTLGGGVWHGDLYLHGGGDPTFGSTAFDSAAYGTGATVQQLALALAAAGVRRVDGAIIGDGSVFDALRGTPATAFAPNLEVEGQLGGLIYDAGFTNATEEAFQPRPALFATQAFVAALRAAGVAVPPSTPVFTATAPTDTTLLASIDSPAMSTLIQLTNAPSDNYFAETLLKDLGANFGAAGTTAAGAAVVGQTIATTFNLHPRFNDGSGLSRFDRTSAAEIVSLLEQQASNQPFIESLAVAGVSGTMEQEMLGTPAVNNCRGKTGTLADVANLAGYCTAANGDGIVFAFLENRLTDATAGHETEDAMGATLAEYDPLTGKG